MMILKAKLCNERVLNAFLSNIKGISILCERFCEDSSVLIDKNGSFTDEERAWYKKGRVKGGGCTYTEELVCCLGPTVPTI